jgi:hypothetical protein
MSSIEVEYGFSRQKILILSFTNIILFFLNLSILVVYWDEELEKNKQPTNGIFEFSTAFGNLTTNILAIIFLAISMRLLRNAYYKFGRPGINAPINRLLLILFIIDLALFVILDYLSLMINFLHDYYLPVTPIQCLTMFYCLIFSSFFLFILFTKFYRKLFPNQLTTSTSPLLYQEIGMDGNNV